MTKTIKFIEKKINICNQNIDFQMQVAFESQENKFKKRYHENEALKLTEKLQNLEQIKCELEAWEICKKKSVDIEKLKLSTCLEEYNSCRYEDICLTDEEYEVLKNREDL